jgi:hypothetical protein
LRSLPYDKNRSGAINIMEKPTLDNELERLHGNLPFLWEDYGFHLQYFARDFSGAGRRSVIGLENKVCKLLFEKEVGSYPEAIRCLVGTKSAWFDPVNYSHSALYHWYPLTELLDWLEGRQYRAEDDADHDMESISDSLRLHIREILDVLKDPKEAERQLKSNRNLQGGNQVAVEEIGKQRDSQRGGTK